jgi:hypothetical protein
MLIPTTAAGFSEALGATVIVMIAAGSVAASAVDSAETVSVVAADFMAVAADFAAVAADFTAVAADFAAVAADFMAVAADFTAVAAVTAAADTDNSHESLIRSCFASTRGGAGAFGL